MDRPVVTHRWVAGRGSAGSAAYAMTVFELRQTRFRLFAVAVTVALTALLVTAGAGSAWFDALLGLVLSGFLLVSCTLLAAWNRRRAFLPQLMPGTELETEFAPALMILRRVPWSETRLEFDGVAGVDVVHGWVLLLMRGQRSRALVPEELIPADDLARLRLVVAGYQPRDTNQ